MEENYFTFVNGKKLGFFRDEEGLTQQELADKLGVTRQTIVSWESKEQVKLRPDIGKTLAKVLQVSIDDLTKVNEKEKRDPLVDPLITNYVDQINTLKKYNSFLENEIERLKLENETLRRGKK